MTTDAHRQYVEEMKAFLSSCTSADLERFHAVATIERFKGDVRAAAAAMGIRPRVLAHRLRSYGFEIVRHPGSAAQPRPQFHIVGGPHA